MTPSATLLGQRWISEFEEEDRETARLLIDSLEIHDHVEVMSALAETIRSSIASNPLALPAVLVPIRSIEDLPPLPAGQSEHVAYLTYDPGAGYPALPGSEADVGSMIRNVIDGSPGKFVSPEQTINQLKNSKVRTLCLVVDYTGSGKQAEAFAATFRLNPTIASWISYRDVQLRIVSYAASLEASQKLNAINRVHFETRIVAKSSLSADWSNEQRDQISRLCRKYAVADDQYPALGFNDSFGLYLSNTRVPNNLPQILIRSGGPFPGLFPGRQYPAALLAELRSYVPAPSLSRTLRNLGAEALAERLEVETRPVQALRALAALHLLDYGISENQVWAMLGLDPVTLNKLRTSLIALEMINLDNRVTRRGRMELQRASSRMMSRSRSTNTRAPVAYEPTQLR